MSRVNPYASIEKRSFETALMRLLLNEYVCLHKQKIKNGFIIREN